MGNLEELTHLGKIVKQIKELGVQESKTKRLYGNGFGIDYNPKGAVEKYRKMYRKIEPEIIGFEEFVKEMYDGNIELTERLRTSKLRIRELEHELYNMKYGSFWEKLKNLF